MSAVSRTLFLAAAVLLALPLLSPAASPDKYLPDDSEVVLTISVHQFLEAPLINRDRVPSAAALELPHPSLLLCRA